MAPSSLKDRLALVLSGMPRGSKAALARACRVKGPSVSDWLSGKTQTLEGENLLNAARFLNVSPEWLATGRGPRERFSSSQTGSKQLDEAMTNGLAHPPSQPLTLDPEMLYEAMTLLVHDEQQGGKFTPRERSMRLAELYGRVAADGGRLSKEHNAEFIKEVMARQEGVDGERESRKSERRS